MKISDVGRPKGANRTKKRRGRGSGSGHGKTSCKGHKGLLARSGGHGGPRLGFEGGQMPLIRRIPKRGFINEFKKMYQIVNIGSLSRFDENAVISPIELYNANLINDQGAQVKILGDGELTKRLTIKAHRFSKSAMAKVKKIGGKFEILNSKSEINPKSEIPMSRT